MSQFILTILNKLNITNDDNKVSITNIVVMIFCVITAVRGLFAGAVFTTEYFTWKIEGLDFSATLPLLFSLLNYGQKRSVLSNNQQTNQGSK